MARCFCRWRNVLICVCTLCVLLLLLIGYITVMLYINLTIVTHGSEPSDGRDLFVAPGVYRNEELALVPKTFWDLQQHRAFWNRLQLAVDRSYNPILCPNSFSRGSESYGFESASKENFSSISNFDKLPHQMQEFVRHMHRRDYPTLLQPNAACGAGAEEQDEPPLLLLAIKSTKLNFKNRQAIRQTWGQTGWVTGRERNGSRGRTGRTAGGYIRRVFLFGKNSEDVGEELSGLLHMESKRYGDMLQWDFVDTFFNLTLKDVLFWRWFSQFCSETHFVFKGDDDVFVNTPAMITFLQDQLQKPQGYKSMRDFMVGDVIAAAFPIRVADSKYFIPDSFFQGRYPAYAGGGGVLYSGLLARRLNHMSDRVHLFPIDDVYVGMCLVRLNTEPIHHPAFLTFDFP